MNHDETPRRAAAERYLDVLAALAPAASLLDVRYRIAESELARFFIAMHARDRATRILRVGQRTDVYVGCAPRMRRSGRREDLAPTALLWVDCDTAAATRALRAFIPAPSMIVVSGGIRSRTHGYWALSRTLPLEQIEQLNCRLAAALGADRSAVTLPTAILRVPGTLSFKRSTPAPVRLLRCSGRRYTPEEISAALRAPPAEGSSAASRAQSGEQNGAAYRRRADGDPLLAIPPSEYVRVLTGCTPGRDGKIHCPFHDDRTPSFHVYDTPERGWTCFGCASQNGRRLGGDIYTLASRLWGIPASGASFFELRDRLDEVFAIARR